MMGTPGKSYESAIQSELLFKFYNSGFISTRNSEQKEQRNREKYVFYCSVSQIYMNPKKPHHNDCLNVPTLYRISPRIVRRHV